MIILKVANEKDDAHRALEVFASPHHLSEAALRFSVELKLSSPRRSRELQQIVHLVPSGILQSGPCLLPSILLY